MTRIEKRPNLPAMRLPLALMSVIVLLPVFSTFASDLNCTGLSTHREYRFPGISPGLFEASVERRVDVYIDGEPQMPGVFTSEPFFRCASITDYYERSLSHHGKARAFDIWICLDQPASLIEQHIGYTIGKGRDKVKMDEAVVCEW